MTLYFLKLYRRSDPDTGYIAYRSENLDQIEAHWRRAWCDHEYNKIEVTKPDGKDGEDIVLLFTRDSRRRPNFIGYSDEFASNRYKKFRASIKDL